MTTVPEEPKSSPLLGLPQIPGYRCVRLLGRGGMGAVYLADDLTLGRQVAIKTLLIQDGDLAARFREEVTAVASVRHPGVLQVFQAGEVDGVPFCAMELAGGGTLAELVAGQPLSSQVSAAIIAPLAEAIHHCHQLCVLHRDLKPSNVLLGARTDSPPRSPDEVARLQLKIADFGLAKKLQGSAKLTQTGDILGTPAYMAPEQASGVVSQLGPGVDIYALGAILYELLTGRPPFQSPDVMQTLMMVISRDPVPPRQLSSGINRDIETICLRCLEKSPKRRYGSAGELADDLHRYLDGRPIVARPIRAWEKGLKWARRRPAAAMLFFGAIVGVAGLIVGVGVLRQKNEALIKAQAETSESLQTALSAISKLLIELGEELSTTPQTEELRRRMLVEAEELCVRLSSSSVFDERGRATVAQARFLLSDIYRLQGRVAEARPMAIQAREDYSQLARQSPTNVDYLRFEIASRGAVARLLLDANEPEAEAEFVAAIERANGVADESIVQLVGKLRNNLALYYARTGRTDLAEREHRALLIDRERIARESPGDEAFRDLAATQSNIGVIIARSGDGQSADQWHAATVESLLKIKRPIPSDRVALGKALLNRNSYLSRSSLEQAEKMARSAVDVFSRLALDFPTVPEHRSIYAYSLMRLGTAHGVVGREKEALEEYDKARVIVEKLVEQFPKNAEYQTMLEYCRSILTPPKKGPS